MDVKKADFAAGETCRAIRALPGHARTPVLALSPVPLGWVLGGEVETAFSDMIAKPIAPDQLYSAVLKALETAAE
jgi:CheY-like chemotaxis protein